MENPLVVLRKALGLTQQQMAEKLGCGYSTLQTFEAGKRLSEEIRAAAVNLAVDADLGHLAHLLSADEPSGPVGPNDYNPANRRWHDMLETILESKDATAISAVQPNIILFYRWVTEHIFVKNKRKKGVG
jgi:transcriptional regulator with XRE-family HTH domain